MSVETEHNEIVSLLKDNNYKPIEENLTAENMSAKGFLRGFVLTHNELDISFLTSNSSISTFQMILQLHYVTALNMNRVKAVNESKIIIKELKELDNFSGFVNSPLYETLDPKHLRVTIIFNYGLQTC